MRQARHNHHMKLPDHLYLSPPPVTPSPPPNSFTSSFLYVRSAVYHTSPAALFYDPSFSARTVGDRIPGFKTSAAFLTTLRANINLEPDSAPVSLASTPDCLRPVNMASALAPPSPSPLAQVADSEDQISLETNRDSLADTPPLTTKSATSEDDKVEALHLIADSVAQQRQLASRAVIFHPGVIALTVLLLGLIYQNLYKGARSDLAIVGTTSAGVIMSLLITVRYFTRGYIEEAESVGTWNWLEKGRDTADAVGDEDEILLSRFGDKPIGALIMRGVRDGTSNGSGNSSPKKRRQNSSGKNSHVTGTIRGWAVTYRYRGKGVGAELLEQAIQLCQEKGWQGPVFADDHANSARILPSQFNGRFEKSEQKAKAMLEKTKEEAGVLNAGTPTGRKGKR